MPTTRLTIRLIPLALLVLSAVLAAAPSQGAEATDADIAELKRAITELRAQNRALAQRIETLELEKSVRSPPADTGAARASAGATTDTGTGAVATGAPAAPAAAHDDLARRVGELEFTKTAQEDATRAIIRDSLAKVGSKVNETVSLGGAVEMLAGRTRDFSGVRKSALQLNTAELDLEIQAGDWASAKLVLEYIDGASALFNSTRGFETAVDRLTVDTAVVTLGDVQRFPLVLQAGRMHLAFGSATGVHRFDTLAIDGPLTTDAFALRRPAIGIGFGLPTPKPTRPALPAVVPSVKPLVLAPLVGELGRLLGYAPPPTRPKPALAVAAPVEPPPFYGSLFVYEGHSTGAQRSFVRNVNARFGYRASGHCGKPYSELRAADFCPWSLDVNLDVNNSVFNSDFLQAEYRSFLDQFGPVRGIASTVKLALGPVMLVGEWAGASASAVFVDDAGTRQRIKPAAWQASVGYQFGWNPWVESIGGQGTYLALGYSRSRDLAGATQLVGSERLRVGALPKSRWTLTAGEWLQEGLKVQFEYSRTTDYPASDGGTGTTGNGIQMTLTYSW